jgi:hypothetical protein
MPMHRTYGQKDEQDTPIGDVGFLGVDDRTDPRRLEPGMVAGAKNKDFSDGTAATRAGWVTPSWGGLLGIHFDAAFDGVEEGLNFDPDSDGTEEGIDFDQCGFGAIYGHLVFSDPYGNEALLVASRSGVWRVRNYSEPELIRLPDRELIDYPVRMIQCFDRVLMLRGTERTVLEWNPQGTVEDGIGEFQEIEQTTPAGSYTTPIPNADYGFVFANRAWILEGRDQLDVSDILDYTRYDATINALRVNAGTDDAIIACVSGKDNRILVCKRRSFYVLDGVFGTDLGFSVTGQEVTRERGLIARDAIVDMGAGAWAYLSDGGVYTLGLTEENKLRSAPAPLSWSIQRMMNRVHWPFADAALMQVHNERLFVALPIDGARQNNALFIYNLTTKQWEGLWTADYLAVVGLPIVTEHGEKRLCILNGTGTTFDAHWVAEVEDGVNVEVVGLPTVVNGVADGAVLIVNEGYADYIYGHTVWIEDELLSRGYGLTSLQQTKHLRLSLDQETWNPNFSIFVRRGSVNSELTVRQNDRRGFNVTAAVAPGTRICRVGWVTYGWEPVFESDDPTNWGATRSVVNGRGNVEIDFRGVFDSGTYVDQEFASDLIYLTITPFDDPYYYIPEDSQIRLEVWDEETKRVVAASSVKALGRQQVLTVNGNVLLYRTLRISADGTDWLMPFDGWLIEYWRGIPSTTYTNDRVQQIYGAEQVLWREGDSPAEIEAEGYNDYAWRLGTGILPGVTLGRMQRQTEVFRVREAGEFAQVRTVCERGRHVLHGMQMDCISGRRGLRSRLA